MSKSCEGTEVDHDMTSYNGKYTVTKPDIVEGPR